MARRCNEVDVFWVLSDGIRACHDAIGCCTGVVETADPNPFTCEPAASLWTKEACHGLLQMPGICHSSSKRCRQAKAIHCALLRNALKNSFPDDPLVLAGDFNTKPKERGSSKLCLMSLQTETIQNRLKDMLPNFTYSYCTVFPYECQDNFSQRAYLVYIISCMVTEFSVRTQSCSSCNRGS